MRAAYFFICFLLLQQSFAQFVDDEEEDLFHDDLMDLFSAAFIKEQKPNTTACPPVPNQVVTVDDNALRPLDVPYSTKNRAFKEVPVCFFSPLCFLLVF